MKPSDQSRFDTLYQEHLNVLRLQELAPAIIDAYSRALRRVSGMYGMRPGDFNLVFSLLIYCPVMNK